MAWRNSAREYGSAAKFFHWSIAASFIAAYILVYYSIWILGREHVDRPILLNLHWIAGVIAGLLVIPRLIWRARSVQPEPAPGTALEHGLAHVVHFLLYAFMIGMPLTGYLGTAKATDFGLFAIPSFKDTGLFHLIERETGISWEAFEKPIDVVHHFVGKWVAWAFVLLHIAAALYHHIVRRDEVLRRMLPGSGVQQQS